MARKVARKTIGVFSIGVGLLFGIFPFVPGVLLIVVGLELLGYRERLWEYWNSKRGRRQVAPLSTPADPEAV